MQLIFPKGDPNGIKVIELTGWDGRAIIVPRTEIGSLKERPEIQASGLYFLFGEDKQTGNQLVYIGESSDCANRLESHDAEKDYWNQAFIFLNPPDRNYLESISAKLSRKAKRYVVKNATQPREEAKNEFDRIKNERYLDGVKKIFSTFGYHIFDSIEDSISDEKFYYLKGEGIDAKAQLLNDGSINVLKHSLARKRETVAFAGWAKAARASYLEDGTMIDNNDGSSYLFLRNIIFKSPSAAAATITGSPINGWTAWKDEKGNTLDKNLRNK